MFRFSVWQSTLQSDSNHNQDHFNNSAQKAMHIHNMFPKFLFFEPSCATCTEGSYASLSVCTLD